MMRSLKLSDWGIACFIARWILGLLFLMAGYWKIFDLTVSEHARQYFIEGFADTWIPIWLLWSLGYAIPFLEFAAGLLLCLGWRIRDSLTALGLLLIVTTYGHALQVGLFNIDGHTFTRLTLILFLLVAPRTEDKISLDNWLTIRKS